MVGTGASGLRRLKKKLECKVVNKELKKKLTFQLVTWRRWGDSDWTCRGALLVHSLHIKK